MSDFKNLDKYIKDRVQSMDFEYDDSQWAFVEEKIIEQEQKKKRRVIYFFTSILMFSLFALVYVYSTVFNTKHTNEQQNIAIQSDSSKEIFTEQKDNSKNTNSNQNLSAQKQDENSISRKPKKRSNKNNIQNKRNKQSNKLGLFNKNSILDTSSYPSIQLNNSDSSNAIQAMNKINPVLLNSLSTQDVLLESEYADQLKQKKIRTTFLSIGTNINEKGGLGYFLNVQTLFILNPKNSISTGLGFSNINAPYLIYTVKDIDYSYNDRVTSTTTETKNLYYLELPIQYRYRFQGSNTLLIGASVNYLLAQKNHITKKTWEGEETEQNEIGKSNDFRTFDALAQIGYERNVLNRYRLGLAYQYSFMNPIVNNQKTINDFNLFNSELRLYLMFNLFNSKP